MSERRIARRIGTDMDALINVSADLSLLSRFHYAQP